MQVRVLALLSMSIETRSATLIATRLSSLYRSAPARIRTSLTTLTPSCRSESN